MWRLGVILTLAVVCVQSFTEDEWSNIEDVSIFVEPKREAPSETRIIGGTEATPNSIPYQAALLIHFEKSRSFCGGSVISENFVLTAAHCMYKAKLVDVILGAHDIRKNETSQLRVTCEEITVHPDWDYQKLQNDIALIKLPQSVSLNKYINTVSLATSGTFADSAALLTGWGKTSDTSKVSSLLNQVNLAVLENSECEEFYEETIQPTHICTSGADIKGGCNGDSGGPLVVDGKQIGIVSFGSNRCTKGYPTVFTRVTEFKGWISKNSDVKIK